jgi:ribonuclease BN (tRNA processing enzyme)
MENRNFIKFLGTAGARHVVAKQLRSSAGVYLNLKNKKIIMDPGPGTLVRCISSKPKIDVAALEGIILTHVHIDHTNDVNILIDAMTGGGLRKKGTLYAPKECLHGENAVVFKYLRSFLEEIVVLEADSQYKIGDLSFSTSIKLDHNVETYGMKFDLGDQKISFITDTRYFQDLAKNYEDSDVLIVNVVITTPRNDIDIPHLSIEDVKKIISEIKPKKAILTHFGMTMLKAKPWEMAQNLADETGIEVKAASDGLTVEL